MARLIQLAEGLSVPPAEIATQVVAALGMRGSGKSTSMAVICEGLLAAKVQVIILDYVGIWFALRLQADGKTPSPFQIPVLGGQHGDISLLPTAGAVVAEALAKSGSAAVLDVSSFRKGDRIKFATDFAEAFFDAKKTHPGPCFLVLEEAQRYVPQVIRFSGTGLERCLGAFEEIAETGRNFGVGLGLISLRPQKINKDVLNLVELLLAFQANGVHERKAIDAWVQEKGAAGREDVKGELPSLRRGTDGVAEAIVWSPSWLKVYGKYVFHKKTTYDASRTPTQRRATVRVRPLDLSVLETDMASVVQQAKDNDPKVLKAEIAHLTRELTRRGPPIPPAKPVIEQVPFVPPAVIKEVRTMSEQLKQFSRVLDGVRLPSSALLVDVSGKLATLASNADRYNRIRVPAPAAAPAKVLHVPAASASRPQPPVDESFRLGQGERAILRAVAQHPDGVTREQLTVLVGYKRSSRNVYLQRLRAAGLIETNGEIITGTEAGIAALGNDFEPLPTGDALREHYLQTLPEGERRVFEIVIEAYPEPVERESIDARTDYKRSSRNVYIQRLGARGLVTSSGRNGGPVRASDTLFGA